MKKIMLGNEAFARGAYEAGVSVVASYPGTPSTEVSEYAAKYDEIYVEWSPNEKVAMEVALGAAVGGRRALTCMKHVGMNVAADPLFTAAYTGINAGLVVMVADDPGIFSSQNEQDSRFYARAAGIPMLEPADSDEACRFMKMAYEMSEAFDTPVIMRSCTRLSHSRSIVELGEREKRPLKPYEKDHMKYVMMPGMARGRHREQERRMKRLAAMAESMSVNCIEYRDMRVGIITSGICYQYVREAMPNASTLKLGMVYPLPASMIEEFVSNVRAVYVVEELEPFIEEAVRAMGIKVIGKELFTIQGEYSVSMIKAALTGAPLPEGESGDLPVRPPIMCVGCPHRAVFYAFSKLGLTVMGDIGCYTLAANPPHMAMDTAVCMGASIGMAMGMEKARGPEFAKKLVAVIGDSTFVHSGITGLVDMVYNGATSTVVILDNSITGMTGHQHNPVSGKNAKGQPAPVLDLEALCRTIGVKHVVAADPYELDRFMDILRQETQRGELSVIISRRPCDLMVKGRKPQTAVVDTDSCVACMACMEVGCPAIMKAAEGVAVDASQCNGCGLCTQLCPCGALKVPAAED